MISLTQEEQIELINGFIQFAYAEMQMDDWTTRRRLFRDEFNITGCGREIDNRTKPTFSVAMEQIHDGSLEDTLYDFFCKGIQSFGWFDAYCLQQRPDLDTRETDVYYYWQFEDMLNNWLWYTDHTLNGTAVDGVGMIKDILGLEICLK